MEWENKIQEFSLIEFFEISRILECHHTVFYAMWEMGKPIYSQGVERSAVKFDNRGENVRFYVNPHFWTSLSSYEKSFIIAHECLHIILNHGGRTVDSDDEMVASVAMDLVVNHMLERDFGFVRNRLSFAEEIFWVETTFPPELNVPTNEIFEFYFNLIKEMLGKNEMEINQSLVDDHSQMSAGGMGSGEGDPQEGGKEGGDGDEQNEDAEGDGNKPDDNGMSHPFDCGPLPDWLQEEINNELSVSEAKSLNEAIKNFQELGDSTAGGLQAGKMAGSFQYFVPKQNVKTKRKWETVIKEWSRKFNKQDFDSMEQWSVRNRRLNCLGSDLMLPSEIDREVDIEGKIEVLFFQDTSGSCSGYIDRFFKAAESLPKDRFDVRLFCFDTQTYETNFKTRKLYGFGGTSFSIIEQRIQSEISKGTIKGYPKAVFVITDGYGDHVHPQIPKNWYWFLTPQSGTYCIPKECNIYKLSDYE